MKQYIITEEQRDALAEVVAVIGNPKHSDVLSAATQENAREVVRCLQSLPELPGAGTYRNRPKALPDGVEIGSHVVAKNPRGGIMHGWYQGYDPYTDGANPHIIRRGEDDGIYRCRKVAPFGSSLMPEDSSPASAAETCEWETIGLTSYNPHYGPLHDGDIRFESVSIVRGWRVCPYCAKPIAIKSGRE